MIGRQRNTWFYCAQPLTQPALRLFCLPHSGGSPALFQQWPSSLPAGVEMHAVQLPGRGLRFREPPYERAAPLVQALFDAIQPLLQDVPFAFFGHSLGALLAYELTHQLQDVGLQPAALFASACHAPQLLPTGEQLHTLPRPELLQALQRINGTPPELFAEEELLDLILPTLRADMAVYETYEYRPREPLSCALVACGGREDSRVAPWQVEAWRAQAAGHFETHLFAGDHFYLGPARAGLMALFERILVQSLPS